MSRILAYLSLCCLAGAALAAGPPCATLSGIVVEQPVQRLTLQAAVSWALQNNPDLAFQRQQHGIAAAGVIIAETYPFNPIVENRIQVANGPPDVAIENRVPLENIFHLDLEILGQGKHRRAAASAALSRTDWEIAAQEQALVVRVIRAFAGVMYRQEKLRLIEETVRFNEELVQDVRRLMTAGKLSGADLIVAQTEVEDSRTLLGPGRTARVTALSELNRALGVVDQPVEVEGTLDIPLRGWDTNVVTRAAMRQRADLRARQVAVAEAEANLRLTVADRFGNPAVGPAYTLDSSRISSIGVQLNLPIPVLNTHKGDILQRQAQQQQSVLDLRRTEIGVRQDVEAALARLHAAYALVETYRSQTLPTMRQSLEGIQKLLGVPETGVDVLRVIDVRRKMLRARDGYLDALFEVSQARADLAAAVGELVVTDDACAPSEEPVSKRGQDP